MSIPWGAYGEEIDHVPGADGQMGKGILNKFANFRRVLGAMLCLRRLVKRKSAPIGTNGPIRPDCGRRSNYFSRSTDKACRSSIQIR